MNLHFTASRFSCFSVLASSHTVLRRSLCIIFLIVSASYVIAAPRTFTGSGNFSDATKWDGGTLPVAGDDLTIDGSCTIDNNGLTDNIQYGNLVIGTTGSGVLNWQAGGTNRLNVANISSSFAGSELDMDNGGILIVRGSWSAANISFTAGTGTVEIQSNLIIPSAVTGFNHLIINSGVNTVSINANTTINNDLTITSGVFTAGAFDLTVTGTATITSTLNITSATGVKSFGNLFINTGTFNNNTANAPITIAGNLTNNGTFNQGTGRVTFTGVSSNIISGTAISTAFGGGITVNKGISNANVLDVQSVITIANGGLTLNNGTLKISSASTLTPFTSDVSTAPYLIPSTAGLWLNGGTISDAGDHNWTIAGLIRMTSGSFTIGSATDNLLIPQTDASVTIEGGATNIAAGISSTGTTWTYTMTNGTIYLNTMGNSTASPHIFYMESGSSFNMAGGMMIIRRAGSSNGGYHNLATGGTGFTAGTLQIGDAGTPAGQVVDVYSAILVDNFAVGNVNATARLTTGPLSVRNTLFLNAGFLNANGQDITVGDNWGNYASTGAFIAGSNTVTMTGTSGGGIMGSFVTTFNHLTINTPGHNVSLSINVNVAGNLHVPAGLFDLGIYTVNRTTPGGNLTLNNGAILRIGGTNSFPSNYSTHSIGATSFTEYTGSNQTISVLNSGQNYGHLRIAGTATKILPANITTEGNLTITASTLNTNNFNLTVKGNFVNNAAGIFINNAIFTVKQNITNNQASMAPGTGTTILDGTAVQFINGSQPFNTYNLETNNTAGVTLNNNLCVSGLHTFVAGDVNTSVTPNYLIYEAGASYTGEADNRHVTGWVKKIGSTDFSFPVGNGSVVRKASIESLSGSLEFNCRFSLTTPNPYNVQSPLILIDRNEYWIINRVDASGSARVHLNWDHSKVPFPRFNLSAIRTAYYATTVWTDVGGSASGNITTTGDITSNSVSAFGNFAFGSIEFFLPVQFINITVQMKPGHQAVEWKTVNEQDIHHFEIERSSNGINFFKIADANAMNTAGEKSYTYNDHQPLQKTFWYRIRSIDMSGKSGLSSIVSVNSKSVKTIQVINDPTSPAIKIWLPTELKGSYNYQLISSGGQLIRTGDFKSQGGDIINLNLKNALSNGMYFLRIESAHQKFVETVVF